MPSESVERSGPKTGSTTEMHTVRPLEPELSVRFSKHGRIGNDGMVHDGEPTIKFFRISSNNYLQRDPAS